MRVEEEVSYSHALVVVTDTSDVSEQKELGHNTWVKVPSVCCLVFTVVCTCPHHIPIPVSSKSVQVTLSRRSSLLIEQSACMRTMRISAWTVEPYVVDGSTLTGSRLILIVLIMSR